MKKARLYSKHKAFNKVHKELERNPSAGAADFEEPKKYHHAPEKLELFKDYRGYIKWSNELHGSSTQLIGLLRKIYDKAENASSSWYESKKNLNNILNEFDHLKSDLADLYDDIFEFQNCMLSTGINEKHAEIEALSDQMRLLATLESKIVETCNRKLYEISSSIVTFANLSIAIVALIISAISLYCS